VSERLDEATMLGSWFKDFADKGHWFDNASGKCVNCGVPTISLYEDEAYGDIRTCAPQQEKPDER
jgi:hypothetical protein